MRPGKRPREAETYFVLYRETAQGENKPTTSETTKARGNLNPADPCIHRYNKTCKGKGCDTHDECSSYQKVVSWLVGWLGWVGSNPPCLTHPIDASRPTTLNGEKSTTSRARRAVPNQCIFHVVGKKNPMCSSPVSPPHLQCTGGMDAKGSTVRNKKHRRGDCNRVYGPPSFLPVAPVRP